jgi:hypothetical protein
MTGFMIISSMLVTTSAYAQETTPGPGKVEVTMIPGGMTFFTQKAAEPSFSNYDLGGAVSRNFTRVVGVEGEIGGSLGITQTLSGLTIKAKTPNMLAYSGNLVVNAPGHSLVPYATGGIGGLTLYNRTVLGITNGANSFLTSNVGGGLKWFAGNGRWGLRGDYRFETVKSKTTATDFFGLSTRHANRIYGAVILNAVR